MQKYPIHVRVFTLGATGEYELEVDGRVVSLDEWLFSELRDLYVPKAMASVVGIKTNISHLRVQTERDPESAYKRLRSFGFHHSLDLDEEIAEIQRIFGRDSEPGIRIVEALEDGNIDEARTRLEGTFDYFEQAMESLNAKYHSQPTTL